MRKKSELPEWCYLLELVKACAETISTRACCHPLRVEGGEAERRWRWLMSGKVRRKRARGEFPGRCQMWMSWRLLP